MISTHTLAVSDKVLLRSLKEASEAIIKHVVRIFLRFKYSYILIYDI